MVVVERSVFWSAKGDILATLQVLKRAVWDRGNWRAALVMGLVMLCIVGDSSCRYSSIG